jgi:hypothetical protein
MPGVTDSNRDAASSMSLRRAGRGGIPTNVVVTDAFIFLCLPIQRVAMSMLGAAARMLTGISVGSGWP